MRRRFVVPLLLALLGSLAAQADRVERVRGQLEGLFDDPAFQRGIWAVKVKSLATGEVLYERNAHRYVMPASNMKLPTAYAAMRRLGLDYTFRTVVGRTGAVSGGALKGDLVVVGSGDPTLGARLSSEDEEELAEGDPLAVFRDWAARLKKAGIERVEGDLVGDVGIFDNVPLGGGWSWDDVAYGYSAAISGLQFNENVVLLRISPGEVGEPARIEMSPATGYLEVDNRIETVLLDEEFSLSLVRQPGSNRVEISGTLPEDRPPFQRSVAVYDPARYFLAVLRETLEGEGVAVDGTIRVHRGEEPLRGPEEIFAHRSPDLRFVLRVFLKISQNLYGETLVKLLDKSPRLKRYEDGRRQVERVLTGAGIPPDAYILADGSGLSRYNYLTADVLIRLLEAIHRDPDGQELASFLPVAGQDGTIEKRMKGTAAEGRVRAKTGTLSNVRALSGFVSTRSGETLAFSMIANNFAQPMRSAEYLQDSALALLANLPSPPGR